MVGMRQPCWLLVLLWGCALALAVPTQQISLLGEVPSSAVEAEGFVEDGVTTLVDLGAGKDDGCSKAYDKFKANVEKVTALKAKAEKKATDAAKKQKEAEAGHKRCKDDQKEVMEKASYKKEV